MVGFENHCATGSKVIFAAKTEGRAEQDRVCDSYQVIDIWPQYESWRCEKPWYREQGAFKSSFICGANVRMFKDGYSGISENLPLILGYEISGVLRKKVFCRIFIEKT